jgi:DNA-binding beta-propeller fold protein YncE
MTDFAGRSVGPRVAVLAAVLACSLAAGASAAALVPADAVARGRAPSHGGFSCRGQAPRHRSAKAYVVGHTALIPVDLATGKVGQPLPSLADPIAIALSPDKGTAYAATANSVVVPIDVTTNAVGKPIATPAGVMVIAISPNGRTAYAAGSGGITPIFLSTCTVGRVIATPGLDVLGPIAITPDGRTAYEGILKPAAPDAGIVIPINLAAGTAGKPIHVPSYPYSILDIAITANACTAYVVNLASVIPVNLTTRKAARPIAMTAGAYFIAITS